MLYQGIHWKNVSTLHSYQMRANHGKKNAAFVLCYLPTDRVVFVFKIRRQKYPHATCLKNLLGF